MPLIGSKEVDREGVDLLFEWISKMTNPTPVDEATATRRRAELAELELLQRDRQPEKCLEVIDRLLTSTSTALMLLRSIDDNAIPSSTATLVVEKAAGHDNVSVRDLFERFLPADLRIETAGEPDPRGTNPLHSG